MAKLLVRDSSEGGETPFLRGILTRSLQDCGLAFDDAYHLATNLRDELHGLHEITSSDLRDRVAVRLTELNDAVAQRYADRLLPSATIRVRYRNGQVGPFSRGRLRLSLQSSGLGPDAATDIAAGVYTELLQQGARELTTCSIQRLTYSALEQQLGDEAAANFLVWEDFAGRDRPLVLLVGGITGSGKSTVAAEVAHIVNIRRTQSTDILREVMRMMVPKRLLPVLHAHSFEAWRALPEKERPDGDQDTTVATGYLTQSELLSVACEAAILRSLQERTSIILEGVHTRPALLDCVPDDSDAIVVPITLAVLKPKTLRKRLQGRARVAPRRHVQHYLENFDSLWRLQTFILSESDRFSVPIIENDDRDRTVQQVIGHIVSRLANDFGGSPDEVFA